MFFFFAIGSLWTFKKSYFAMLGPMYHINILWHVLCAKTNVDEAIILCVKNCKKRLFQFDFIFMMLLPEMWWPILKHMLDSQGFSIPLKVSLLSVWGNWRRARTVTGSRWFPPHRKRWRRCSDCVPSCALRFLNRCVYVHWFFVWEFEHWISC